MKAYIQSRKGLPPLLLVLKCASSSSSVHSLDHSGYYLAAPTLPCHGNAPLCRPAFRYR